MSGGDTKGRRPYRQRARAAATEATRAKILDAVEEAFEELLFDEITLSAVADRAGVSVQTILRHFETKDELFVASLLHTGTEVVAERDVLPFGDLGEILDVLLDHYERHGRRVLRMLAQEEREPVLKQVADLGRAYHLEWCKQAFAPTLKGLRGAERKRRTAQLVALTNIYTWKLLRLDRGLSRRQAELALRELLEPLTAPS
ncbi:MAG: TetR/AcrR family transcriptional regulator [Solirubrobacterales bacterium]